MFSGCVTALDNSADVRWRSLTSYKFITSVPQASGTGSDNPPLLFTHTAVTSLTACLWLLSLKSKIQFTQSLHRACLMCIEC